MKAAKTTLLKMRKHVQADVYISHAKVKISLPRQLIGTVAVLFNERVLHQWELVLDGDHLKTVRIK